MLRWCSDRVCQREFAVISVCGLQVWACCRVSMRMRIASQ